MRSDDTLPTLPQLVESDDAATLHIVTTLPEDPTAAPSTLAGGKLRVSHVARHLGGCARQLTAATPAMGRHGVRDILGH